MNDAKSSLFAMILLKLFLLFLCLTVGNSESTDQNSNSTSSKKTKAKANANVFLPRISPSLPFLPFVAPSPVMNHTTPKLSGRCNLNFSVAESLITTTAVDCYGPFAPLLANVICCPQLEATLAILIGKSSNDTNFLSLNRTTSKYCLSDFTQLLSIHGVTSDLTKLCSIQPANLTGGTCPVESIDEFEKTVDVYKIVAACRKIDPVRECCEQTCQNAVLDAATRLSLRSSEALKLSGSSVIPGRRISVAACRDKVLQWLASRLDTSSAKEVLRALSNCQVNKVCPLVLPDAKHVTMECGNELKNKSMCCNAMNSYISHLQKQTLITNLQAMHCATALAKKLNITKDLFNLCHITLKDFSLQVQSQEYGCLLPSLPSDATLDKNAAVSFTCDLNDNILAPWPSSYEESISVCNETVKIPALPAVASTQPGLNVDVMKAMVIIVASTLVAMMV